MLDEFSPCLGFGVEDGVSATGISPDGVRGADAIAKWAKVIRAAQTVLWNGPMGLFEVPRFAKGTFDVAKAVKDIKAGKVEYKAEKAGVILGIESWLSAADTMRILNRVGSPAVKMYYDVCNSTDRGYDICKEIRWLGKKPNPICPTLCSPSQLEGFPQRHYSTTAMTGRY